MTTTSVNGQSQSDVTTQFMTSPSSFSGTTPSNVSGTSPSSFSGTTPSNVSGTSSSSVPGVTTTACEQTGDCGCDYQQQRCLEEGCFFNRKRPPRVSVCTNSHNKNSID